jgi:hypothetical protein
MKGQFAILCLVFAHVTGSIHEFPIIESTPISHGSSIQFPMHISLGEVEETRLVQLSTRSSASRFSLDGASLTETPLSVSFNSLDRTITVSEDRYISREPGNILAASPSSSFASTVGDFMFVAPRYGDSEPTLRLVLSPGEEGARSLCEEHEITYVDGVEDIQMNGDPRWMVNAVVTVIPAGTNAVEQSGTAMNHAQSWVHMHLYHISPNSPVDILDSSVWSYDFLEHFTNAGAVAEEDLTQDGRIILGNCTSSLERFPSFRYSLFTYTDPQQTQLEKALDLLIMPADYTTMIDDDRCILNMARGGGRHQRISEQNVFGLNIFKNSNIHFDAINRRIGFGDPIE